MTHHRQATQQRCHVCAKVALYTLLGWCALLAGLLIDRACQP